MQITNNTKYLLYIVIFLLVATLACGNGDSSSPSDPAVIERQSQETSTIETKKNSTIIPTSTQEHTPTEQSSQTIEPSPTIEPLIDVFSILGKTYPAVENILGPTVLITPINNQNDILSGGEYRDYEVGDYIVFVSYDRNGIARVFQVLEGLSDKNYSITEWDLILPEFGVFLSSPPDRKAPAAVYWDDHNGFFIAVVASNSSGKPVWTIQISEAAYQP